MVWNKQKDGFWWITLFFFFNPISDLFCIFDNTYQLSSEPSNRRGFGNSLVVQWLELCTLTAKSPGSIPSWGTKTPQAMGQLSL